MPPKLSTGGRADPPTEPRPAHNTWPIQHVSVAAWRARNTAAVVVRTTMSAVSCQSSRECCRNFGNVPATSGTFPKFPQGCSAISRWTPSIRRCFAKSNLVGICASLLFSPACAKDTGWCHGPASTLTRYRSWGGDGSMSGVAHLCRAARGMCARAQRRPVPWDSCPPIATACVVAIPIQGSQRADRDCWLDICFEKFLIDDRSLVEPLCASLDDPGASTVHGLKIESDI